MKSKKIVLREEMPVQLGPVPKATTEHVSKSMKGNKAKDTKPELLLRKALWSAGTRGYRLNWKKIPGKPDITFPGKKIAIFVNGCFWHRCPICDLPLPKSNIEFWTNKFTRNVERDKLKTQRLEELGWTVITIWECQIKKDLDSQVIKVKELIASL
jgi:DNA mismatch endonuclease (patch repair protein)